MGEEGGKRGSSGESTAGGREKEDEEEEIEEDGEKGGRWDVDRRGWYVPMLAPTIDAVGV